MSILIIITHSSKIHWCLKNHPKMKSIMTPIRFFSRPFFRLSINKNLDFFFFYLSLQNNKCLLTQDIQLTHRSMSKCSVKKDSKNLFLHERNEKVWNCSLVVLVTLASLTIFFWSSSLGDDRDIGHLNKHNKNQLQFNLCLAIHFFLHKFLYDSPGSELCLFVFLLHQKQIQFVLK